MTAVVLMYHRLARQADPLLDPGAEVYTIAPEVFEEQLAIITRGSGGFLPYERLAEEWLSGRRPSPQPGVAITFDDGHASNYVHALPALLRHGLRAAFFITPAWIGRAGYLDWSQARDLLDHGMVVGAHGLDHTLLSTLPEAQVRFQLREARRLMHEQLGRGPEYLSLPGGAGGARVVRLAHEEGYRVVAGSVPGRCGRGGAGRAVPRFAVRRQDSLSSFRGLIEQRTGPLLRAGMRHHVLARLRAVVGPSVYERLRDSWARWAVRS